MFRASAWRRNFQPASSSKIEFRPVPADHPEQRHPDIAEAQPLLGRQPTLPLRNGLTRTIKYFSEIIARERASAWPPEITHAPPRPRNIEPPTTGRSRIGDLSLTFPALRPSLAGVTPPHPEALG